MEFSLTPWSSSVATAEQLRVINQLSPQFRIMLGTGYVGDVRMAPLGRFVDRENAALVAFSRLLLSPHWGLMSGNDIEAITKAIFEGRNVSPKDRRQRGYGASYLKNDDSGMVRYLTVDVVRFLQKQVRRRVSLDNMFAQLILQTRPDLEWLARKINFSNNAPAGAVLSGLWSTGLRWFENNSPTATITLAMESEAWCRGHRFFLRASDEVLPQIEMASILSIKPASVKEAKRRGRLVWSEGIKDAAGNRTTSTVGAFIEYLNRECKIVIPTPKGKSTA